jgi:transcriptional regulator with XRE-family HTH domain
MTMVQNLEKIIGKRIKEHRSHQNLSLRTLAERCGLSANAISLIERGENSATISSLDKISEALNIPIDDLFKKNQKEFVFYLRSGEGLKKKSYNFEIETLGFGFEDQQIEPLRVTIYPSEDESPQLIFHPGQEFVYCLSGEIDFFIQGRCYHLAVGDSLLFDASHSHGWGNPLVEKAVLLIMFQSLIDPVSVRQRHIELKMAERAD